MESRGEFKRCPVCKTSVFADMDVCYNCMYRFGSNEKLESVSQKCIGPDSAAGSAAPSARGADLLFSEFLVEFERFLGDFLADRVVDIK